MITLEDIQVKDSETGKWRKATRRERIKLMNHIRATNMEDYGYKIDMTEK